MRLSYSSLDTYQTCSLKYKYREIDKIPEEKSKEAVFGTLIHSAMKFIHEPALLPPSVEQAIDYFGKNWKGDLFENELEERAVFVQGVEMIQRYYESNTIAEMNPIALESRFSIEIGTEQTGKHIIAGVIDRIDRTRDGYEIIDYKTAKKMPSQDKIDNDLQLSIYLRAFLARYPKEWERLDQITVSLYFLKHGVKLSSTRTREQLEALDETFLEVIHAIEAGKFVPTLSPLCDWCSFQKICPLWKHKFKEIPEVPIEKSEADFVIEEFLALRNEITVDKKRLAELQEKIMEYMEQEKVERLFGSTGIIGKSVRTTYVYDEEKLRELLSPLGEWENVVKVDGVALKTVLAALPETVRKKAEGFREKKESISLSVKATRENFDDSEAI
ncbi:MAG: PD-(D/E)XK nuclease family protein [Candidatus Moraniibacteriota bacterium]